MYVQNLRMNDPPHDAPPAQPVPSFRPYSLSVARRLPTAWVVP